MKISRHTRRDMCLDGNSILDSIPNDRIDVILSDLDVLSEHADVGYAVYDILFFHYALSSGYDIDDGILSTYRSDISISRILEKSKVSYLGRDPKIMRALMGMVFIHIGIEEESKNGGGRYNMTDIVMSWANCIFDISSYFKGVLSQGSRVGKVYDVSSCMRTSVLHLHMLFLAIKGDSFTSLPNRSTDDPLRDSVGIETRKVGMGRRDRYEEENDYGGNFEVGDNQDIVDALNEDEMDGEVLLDTEDEDDGIEYDYESFI
jgi:hypothetical protein